MELDILNRLYLELSNVVTAKTQREIDLEKTLSELSSELWVYIYKYGPIQKPSTPDFDIDFDGRSEE